MTIRAQVLRTAALTALELAPIAAFSTVVWAVAPALRAELGPMERESFSSIWIFEAGVVNVWIADVLFQRVFAPSAPQLRIANASDAAARHMCRLVRAGALLGMGAGCLRASGRCSATVSRRRS